MFKNNMSVKGLIGIIFTLLFILGDVLWADISYYVNGKGDVVRVVETTIATSKEISNLTDSNSSVIEKSLKDISKRELSDDELNLIAVISQGEGTSLNYLLASSIAKKNNLTNPYDATYGFGKYVPKGTKVSTMTFGEVKKLQRRMISIQKRLKKKRRSSVIGMMQFNQATLKEFQKKCGLKDSDLFSEINQNKMTVKLLKEIGLKDFKAGKISAYRFQNKLAGRWASIACPKTGKSKYNQPTKTSTKKIRLALSKLR